MFAFTEQGRIKAKIQAAIAKLSDVNVQKRRAASQDLGNLTAHFKTNINTIKETRCLEHLMVLLTDPDVEIRRYVGNIINVLAGSTSGAAIHKTFQMAIIEIGAIPVSITLLKDPDTQVRRHAALTLMLLMGDQAAGRNALREAGGMPALISVLEDPDEKIKDYAFQALRWSGSRIADQNALVANRNALREAGIIQVCIAMFKGSSSSNLKTQAAMMLTDLSTEVSIRDVIRESGGIPVLLAMVKDPDFSVKNNIGTLLLTLADDSVSLEAIRTVDGAKILIASLRDSSVGLVKISAKILYLLSLGDETILTLIVGKDAIPLLENVVGTYASYEDRQKIEEMIARCQQIIENRRRERLVLPNLDEPALAPGTITALALESSTMKLSISRAEFEDITNQLALMRESLKFSESNITEEIQTLQQGIQRMSTQARATFTAEEAQSLQERIRTDKAKEMLLIERQTILLDINHRTYYQTLQTHISELMVASLGVGSGYISVNNSKGAKVVGWVCDAISSVFPGASVVTSMIGAGVSYLDMQYRQDFLNKVRVLGTTITEAEILGEQIARLLVRAHYHAEHVLTSQKADDDAKALIMAIVEAQPAVIRDERTPETLLRLVLGDIAYCIDPLPSQPSPKMPRIKTAYAFQQDEASFAISSEDGSVSMQELICELEKERAERRGLAEEFARHKSQAALVSDMPSKKEVSALKADVAKLKGNHSNGGGQVLMSHEEHTGDFTTDMSIKLEQRHAHLEAHIIEGITPEIIRLQEETEQNKSKIAEMERLLMSARVLPKKSVFSTPLITKVTNGDEDPLKLMTPEETEIFNQQKSSLFS